MLYIIMYHTLDPSDVVPSSEPSTEPLPKLFIQKYMQQGKTQLDIVGQLLEEHIQSNPPDSRISRAQYLNLLNTTSEAAIPAAFIEFYPATIETVCSEDSWRRIPKYLPWLVERFQMEIRHIIHQHNATIRQGVAVQEMLEDDGEAWELQEKQQALTREMAMRLDVGISAYRISLDFWNRVQISAQRMKSDSDRLEGTKGHDSGARGDDVKLLLGNIRKESRLVTKKSSLELSS